MFLFFSLSIPGITDSCKIGANKKSSMKLSQLAGMFINLESPAQCRGVVMSWRYCFYRPSGIFLNYLTQFTASFMIYRKNSSNNNQFHVVRESNAHLSIEWNNIENNFQCQDKVLTEREQFEVLQNDIVGVCFRNGLLTYPIPLVGMSIKANRWTYQTRNNRACSTRIEQLDVGAEYFDHQPSLVLHVHANISELHLIDISTVCIIIFKIFFSVQ